MREISVAVVGAGIVGLGVAYHLVGAGARVTLIDRDPEGDKASLGNAGGIAVTEVVPASGSGALWRAFGWMLDPLGPLAVRPTHAPKLIPWLVCFAKSGRAREVDRISRALAALNSRVYEDLVPMLESTGLAGELNRKGALSIYETEEGYRRDAAEWELKRARGVIFRDVDRSEARDMEPALGSLVWRAVFMPQWSYLSDPKRLVQGLRKWLLSRGVMIRRGEVQNILNDAISSPSVQFHGGEQLPADKVVVAAGAWSGILARRLGDRVLLESERGYNATLPQPDVVLERQLIFAERKFVATPLSCGLRIGGAAEFGGLDAKPNYRRSEMLLTLARGYLPGLKTDGAAYWAGHRPATPDSLPVIGASRSHPSVFYAFGHGHLGLTQAATTGRLICDAVFRQRPVIDMAPFAIDRFR